MHIAIIGNGISGVTAARFIRKLSDHQITLISGETEYFWSRTALMYIYMGHMRFEDTQAYEPWFWKKNRIDLKFAYVQKIDAEKSILSFSGGEELAYDKLIIACGSTPNKFGWPGQDLNGVSGMYSYQDLQTIEAYSTDLQRAVIVGGGLIGIELAEMFRARHIPVTFLVRESSFWNMVLAPEESAMINRHIQESGIDLRLETELAEILDEGTGRVQAVMTNKGERIDCGFVGLTAGVRPNIRWLEDSGIETARGILVDAQLRTSAENIYAIGDCAQLREPLTGRRPIEAVWYTGRMMGETVAYTICKNPKDYDPGLWFNSAKFFDIEYQVYGHVPARLPEEYETLYWEHPEGRKAIRLVYRNDTKSVVGVQVMGIRYRHEVCEKWISSGTHVEEVLQQMGIANFDPEFYQEYEREVIDLYNAQTGSHLRLLKRRGLKGALKFLNFSHT